MLYAHYEGFVKNCLTAYYDDLSKKISDHKSLSEKTKEHALRQRISKIRNLEIADFVRAAAELFKIIDETPPQFPEVDTRSNLWPSVLADLLEYADINSIDIKIYSQKIKTLVSRRNSIAHGSKSFIEEIPYYLEYEECIKNLMYDIAISIDERLSGYPAN
jgi:hypothetical protein